MYCSIDSSSSSGSFVSIFKRLYFLFISYSSLNVDLYYFIIFVQLLLFNHAETNPVPYTRDKAAIVSSLQMESSFEGPDGGSCGITIKKVKAKKPKKGASSAKVTVKLKGSTKAEKKAVKAMNKQLKAIMVGLESTGGEAPLKEGG